MSSNSIVKLLWFTWWPSGIVNLVFGSRFPYEVPVGALSLIWLPRTLYNKYQGDEIGSLSSLPGLTLLRLGFRGCMVFAGGLGFRLLRICRVSGLVFS